MIAGVGTTVVVGAAVVGVLLAVVAVVVGVLLAVVAAFVAAVVVGTAVAVGSPQAASTSVANKVKTSPIAQCCLRFILSPPCEQLSVISYQSSVVGCRLT